jgi:hypothetical protein
VEFWDEFKRAKAINLELRSRIVLAAGEPPVSIFDRSIEGFGADVSKLHKRIMEERDEFRSWDLSQRAASLPITDPRRMAFYANTKDPFSKSFHSGFPVPKYPLYKHTVEYNKCTQCRCPDAGIEGLCRQAPSVGLA